MPGRILQTIAQTQTAPQVNLEEPIAGRVETLGKKEVRLVPGVDMGHAPVIDQNFNRLPQVGQVTVSDGTALRWPA
jgi:hypothetical protein